MKIQYFFFLSILFFSISCSKFYCSDEECVDVEVDEKVVNNLQEIRGAYIKTQTLIVACRLELFDHIKDEPVDSYFISTKLGVCPDFLFRWFKALSYLGYMNHHKFRLFSITDMGKYLRKDHPSKLWHLYTHKLEDSFSLSWRSESVMKMLKGEEKKSSHEILFETNFWDFLKKDEEISKSFHESTEIGTVLQIHVIENLFTKLKWNGVEKICDIGGGTGIIMDKILSIKGNEKLKGIVLELFNATSEHFPIVNKDRIEFINGDFFVKEDIPKEMDYYFLSHVIHDWNDEKSIIILKNILASAKIGSRIIITENILPDVVNQENGGATLFDLHIMVVLGGKQRNVRDFESLLIQSGWKFEDVFISEKSTRKGMVIGVKSV